MKSLFFIVVFLLLVSSCLGAKNYDKYLHFSVSFTAYGLSSYILEDIGGLLFTLSIGIGKEVRDCFSPSGSAEFEDLLADIAGITMGYLFAKSTSPRPLLIFYLVF
ncbi:hypothetical protein [Kosmotoga pacifica]|uniref:VanZ-like domain-containing protein n=1 Tax=Kosmotoga pacifica TaxID=1330330 RepID=A0A0G2Z9I3_9BACT|nr:hypothetical protein [Kosmotoga pacifica]AKI98217.1 hypothetical protein IX53_02580 [Kosmotoga pacifica]